MSEQTALEVRQQAGPDDRTARMTTAQLNDLLHAHFIKAGDRLAPAGAGAIYLTEVTDPGGLGRRADAVHIGLWQSRGAGRIDVCELKTSRSDFRRELEQPSKAEAWWPYCTTFSIVSPGTDITPPDELPPGWGLLIPSPRGGRRFKTVVKPAERQPKLTVGLLLTVLKCTETTRTNALAAQGRHLRDQYAQELRKAREEGSADPRARERLKLLSQLEHAMAVKLGDYTWENVLTPAEAAEGLVSFMRGYKERITLRQRIESQADALQGLARRAEHEAGLLMQQANEATA
ncbi:hypothetical protein ACIBCO_35995 [Streptomyces violascens]|uniref:hypothetical protein n=1 Tax=Streptomyces violascens TaxID=67381 RepID=UPI003794210C